MQHDHDPRDLCHANCPNRLANMARSDSMRCEAHGKINCPSLGCHYGPDRKVFR